MVPKGSFANLPSEIICYSYWGVTVSTSIFYIYFLVFSLQYLTELVKNSSEKVADQTIVSIVIGNIEIVCY